MASVSSLRPLSCRWQLFDTLGRPTKLWEDHDASGRFWILALPRHLKIGRARVGIAVIETWIVDVP